MPLYDCGERECQECQSAFGPNREKAIRIFEAREFAYAMLSNAPPVALGEANSSGVRKGEA